MTELTTEQRIAALEQENTLLKRRIQSWGGEIPEGVTTRWLTSMTDVKQQTRKDGTVNPYMGMTSIESTIWWWENIEKPKLLGAP